MRFFGHPLFDCVLQMSSSEVTDALSQLGALDQRLSVSLDKLSVGGGSQNGSRHRSMHSASSLSTFQLSSPNSVRYAASPNT